MSIESESEDRGWIWGTKVNVRIQGESEYTSENEDQRWWIYERMMNVRIQSESERTDENEDQLGWITGSRVNVDIWWKWMNRWKWGPKGMKIRAKGECRYRLKVNIPVKMRTKVDEYKDWGWKWIFRWKWGSVGMNIGTKIYRGKVNIQGKMRSWKWRTRMNMRFHEWGRADHYISEYETLDLGWQAPG